MKLFSRQKPETAAPSPVFDLVAAEKAFLSQHQVQLTGSTLCVRKGGKFTPLTEDVAAMFLRSHLIMTDQMRFWRRDLAADFLAFLKAGL